MSAADRVVNEIEQVLEHRPDRTAAHQFRSGDFDADTRTIQQLVGRGQHVDIFLRIIVTLQPDDVDRSRSGRLAVDDHVGGNVMQDSAHSTDEAQLADRCEMMHADATGDRDIVADVNMTTEHALLAITIRSPSLQS